MTGGDQVQVRDPALPAGVRLDEKPPPRPAIQLRRNVTPAIPGQQRASLAGHGSGVTHRCHQVEDRLGGEPGHRRRPDMLDALGQPRC
jgi:hypothetical protein